MAGSQTSVSSAGGQKLVPRMQPKTKSRPPAMHAARACPQARNKSAASCAASTLSSNIFNDSARAVGSQSASQVPG